MRSTVGSRRGDGKDREMAASQDREVQGEAGVALLELLIQRHFGWSLKRYGHPERGIDAIIELADDGVLNGRLIGVQVKTGASYFKPTEGGWRFSSDYNHLDYWLNHSLPVIVALVNLDSSEIYWSRVSREDVTRHGKSWSLLVPEEQALDQFAEDALRAIASASPQKILMDRLFLDIPFIRRCLQLEQKDEFAYLRVIERPDYASGNEVRIHLLNGSRDDIAPAFSYRTTEIENLEEALTRQYPWASFELDDNMYYENERVEWAEAYGDWDRDLEKYTSFAISFREYRSTLPRIRPASGIDDQTEYDLKLGVNAVGHAIVVLDDFLAEVPEM